MVSLGEGAEAIVVSLGNADGIVRVFLDGIESDAIGDCGVETGSFGFKGLFCGG